MKVLEFLELLALVIGIPFTLFVLLPFALAWVVGWTLGEWMGVVP
jgi:hypothetical protein